MTGPYPVEARGRTPAGRLVELVQPVPGGTPDTGDSSFEDYGDLARDPAPAGLGRLTVVVDGVVAGAVSWHRESYGPTTGSRAWNIGIGLAEHVRGAGVGTVAQRLLAGWLLDTTGIDRVEASTDVENVAEQRSLEKAGFVREGVVRAAQLRADGRHDLVVYSRLRSDGSTPV